ncbi:MAG: hypothetical protein A2283_11925 [Lentisphaerae bacterium RIFOXYA12_FULL_48_11]|nr:MAG: hypothetical protein A2283_11925 [Lentisphaerae bacterium RIFOXYA12_FULL_48_11]
MNPSANRLIHISFGRRIASGLLSCIGAIFRLVRIIGNLSNPVTDAAMTVIEPYNMGDVVSLEPMIRLLSMSGKRVTVIARQQWRSLLPKAHICKWIDSELPWSAYDGCKKYRVWKLFSADFLKHIRHLRCSCKGSIGIDVRGDIRSIIILYLAGCREVLSLDCYSGSDLRISPIAARLVSSDHFLRKWEQGVKFCSILGVAVDGKMLLPPDMRHLLSSEVHKQSSTVGLVIVAPWTGRTWPDSKWQALVTGLKAKGFTPVVFCGPGQKETAARIIGACSDIVESNNIEEFARNLSGVKLVVSLDSGPMHLADALGIPVIGLFGPGKLPLWAPSGKFSVVIHHQDKAESVPCHQVDECVEIGLKAMDLINVEEVLDEVVEINAKMVCIK